MVILAFRTPGPTPGLLISLIALCNSTHEHTHAYARAHTYALLYAQTIPLNEKRPILSGIARLSRAAPIDAIEGFDIERQAIHPDGER